jgi:hypothetical protein
MATVNRGTIYVATESFVVWDEGRMVRFRRGRTTIREGHPFFADHEYRFRPQTVDHEFEPPKAKPEPKPAAAKPEPKPAAEPVTD